MDVTGCTISLKGFKQVLEDAVSPLRAMADDAYAYAYLNGVDPCYMLAVMQKETSFGRQGVGEWPQRNAWALRLHRWGRGEKRTGGFSWYASYLSAAQDFVDLIAGLGEAPDYYIPSGNRTVETITPIYAPPSENATRLYIEQVIASMERWQGLYPMEEEPMSGVSLDEWQNAVDSQLTDIRSTLDGILATLTDLRDDLPLEEAEEQEVVEEEVVEG